MPEYRKILSPHSPLRNERGLSELLDLLVGLPTQIVVVPHRIDHSSFSILLPNLTIIETYEETIQRLGYLPFGYSIPLTVAGDLQLLRNAQTNPIEIPWEEALELARTSLSSLSCGACRDFLRSACPKDTSSFGTLAYSHGDLHFGNIVRDESGLRVLDLDNLHTSPPFTDLVMFFLEYSRFTLIDRSRLISDFEAAAAYLASLLDVPLTPADLAYGTGMYLARAHMSTHATRASELALCALLERFSARRDSYRHDREQRAAKDQA